jgi:hypothetical protein
LWLALYRRVSPGVDLKDEKYRVLADRRGGTGRQGAGVHHNATPGPARSPYVYGHVFVVLALLVAHPTWGVVALPRDRVADQESIEDG